jgi:hypothetical protein
MRRLDADVRRARLLVVARIPCATIALLLLMHALVSAQDVTEPALKAAFIYNFVKFTEWPAGVMSAAEPLVMCVIGDEAVGEALERVVKARVVGGHGLTVSSVVPAPHHPCHVVYVSGTNPGQAAQLVASLHDVPVLTISDIEGFTRMGGIAQFHFEQGRLRFTIHLESAKRVNLEISSRLLALATLD